MIFFGSQMQLYHFYRELSMENILIFSAAYVENALHSIISGKAWGNGYPAVIGGNISAYGIQLFRR